MRSTTHRRGEGIAALLAAMACLTACTGEGQEVDAFVAGPTTAGAQLPRQSAVAGMRGLRTRSTVVFASMPEAPHTLTAVFAFPQRGFWRLQQTIGRSYRRRLVYRLGDQVLHVAPESADSQTLEEGEARDLLLQMELRLAAMLWPDGPGWTRGEYPERVALPSLGTLEAHGSSVGEPPQRFVAYRLDGSELETFSDVEWTRRQGRLWPCRWVLESEGQTIWREEIEEVDASGIYSDGYFVPYDRLAERVVLESDSFDSGIVQEIVIPARTIRRFPLPEGSSWIEALAEARSLSGRWNSALEPPALDARVEIELTDSGRPLAVRLRLSELWRAPLPAGWEAQEPCRAASKLVSDPPRIEPALVRRLRSSLPAADRAGLAYVLLDLSAAEATGSGQLVMPARREP